MKQSYNFKEVCSLYGLSSSNLFQRALIRKIPVRYRAKEKGKRGRDERFFYLNEVEKIIAPFVPEPKFKTPDVYVIERILTFEILHSKLNYLPLNKL